MNKNDIHYSRSLISGNVFNSKYLIVANCFRMYTIKKHKDIMMFFKCKRYMKPYKDALHHC